MKFPPLRVIVLSLASCIASASTAALERPRVAAAASTEAALKDEIGAMLAQCYALDAAARHECIYAALVRSRASKGATQNHPL